MIGSTGTITTLSGYRQEQDEWKRLCIIGSTMYTRLLPEQPTKNTRPQRLPTQ